MRFCIDYRRLNDITIKDAFPLPRIDEIFDQLSAALYYTKFDFKSGYFQISLSEEDRPKTAFSTRDNHYQFTVLPQGITNGPATFQRLINHILGPSRWKYALAYIDDVLIYSKTFDDHIEHLNEICTVLKNARFRLNPEKCEIAQTQTDYLGHQVKNGEIRPSPNNINGLLNTKLPQTADEACKFTQQKKGQKTLITLTPDEVKAFEQLKHYLTTDLVLRLPNNRFPFKVQTDASDEGIGAVLLQVYPDGNRPVSYLSKKFTQAKRKWSPMEQECYAFICSLDKWNNYLSGIKFIWETDHKALTQLNKKAQINKRCERWRLKILEYDFQVKHIPGLTNSMPDYLSRSPVDSAEEDPDEISSISQSTQTDVEDIKNYSSIVTAVETRSMKLKNQKLKNSINIQKLTSDSLVPTSTNQPIDNIIQENRKIPFTIEELMQAQQNDNYAKNILNNIKKHKNYIIQHNLLMRRSKNPIPYVPPGEFRRTILKIYHDSAANGAHFGRDKTLHKIQTRYFWPSMHKDINNYIKSCIPCAQFNPRRQKTPGTLKPITPPEGVWQLVAMDFHGPITPTSHRGNKYIISLTDILSKFVVTKAVRDNSAQTTVRFLKEDVITKFGTPRCMLTDNGTHFTLSMMNELIKQVGSTHLYSTPYHPETNGQVERYNSTMDAKIATLSNLRKTDWDDQLPFVTFNYNTSIHSSTKQVPFEMMYGRLPVLPFDHQADNVTLSHDHEHSKKLAQYLSSLNEQAKLNIINYQQKYKQRYDTNRPDPSYNIGDIVLVKTLNHRSKFDIRYEGPFRIIKKMTSKTFVVQHIKKQTLQRQNVIRKGIQPHAKSTKKIPATSTTKLQNNLRKRLTKQIKEHECALNYTSFVPFPYISYFINRTTTESCLHQIIKAATSSTEFTIDSESITIFKQRNQPALLQLQILLPYFTSFALLIEVHHLPNENSTTFKLIRQLFEIIFSMDKKNYIWGFKMELYPFIIFNLFTKEQVDRLKTINLQQQFKIFWNQQHPRHSSNPTTSNILTNNCMCEECLNIGLLEFWSLQNAVKFELNQYLSKQFSTEKFNIGLDSNLHELESNNKHYRQQLTDYASNDCLAMQRLIVQMKHKSFIFVPDQIKHIQPVKIEFTSISSTDDDDDDILYSSKSNPPPLKRIIYIKPTSQPTKNPTILNDQIELISSDEDEFTLSSNLLKSSTKPQTPSIGNLKNQTELSCIPKEELIPSYSTEQPSAQIYQENEKLFDSKFTLSNNNRSTRINLSNIQTISNRKTNNEKILPEHKQRYNPLTREQRKRIHNRSCTLKQRNRYYRNELIFYNIDHRFTIQRIKSILRQLNIYFYVINTSTSAENQKTLYVGIRDPSLLQTYKEQTRNLFSTRHYLQHQVEQRRSHGFLRSHHYHHH
ncbi:unnamed protein product [Rotaria magnacalcarata]|uniref:Uncharacterized protein n=1 Tax=Rotaria magnacalcarata TaxID=392030 RepID=A0A815YTE6_9BILA|nr:unnamed protein product [Rotaria magnacalcarata]